MKVNANTLIKKFEGIADDDGVVVSKQRAIELSIAFCECCIDSANSLQMHNKAYIYSAIKSSLSRLNIV